MKNNIITLLGISLLFLIIYILFSRNIKNSKSFIVLPEIIGGDPHTWTPKIHHHHHKPHSNPPTPSTPGPWHPTHLPTIGGDPATWSPNP